MFSSTSVYYLFVTAYILGVALFATMLALISFDQMAFSVWVYDISYLLLTIGMLGAGIFAIRVPLLSRFNRFPLAAEA